MHFVWDGGMIERMSRSEDYWLKELTVLPSPQSPIRAPKVRSKIGPRNRYSRLGKLT